MRRIIRKRDKEELHMLISTRDGKLISKRKHPSKIFENIVIVLILLSSVILCIDTPLIDPDSTLKAVLFHLDVIITFLFLLEAIIKILAFGFLYNGDEEVQPYIRNYWNMLDFVVVMASLIDYHITLSSGSSNSSLKSLKAFRALRALRPLRMISRNEGLRLVVNALFASLPGMTNVLLVCFLFIIIFAIMGVNFFKGAFHYCYFDPLVYATPPAVDTKIDCLAAGGEWVNNPKNFDHVFRATLTIFEMMTGEGWLYVMYNGIDHRGPDLEPRRNNQPTWALYFICFMVIGSMFIINLFVGVVIDNFNKIKETEEMGNMFVTSE